MRDLVEDLAGDLAVNLDRDRANYNQEKTLRKNPVLSLLQPEAAPMLDSLQSPSAPDFSTIDSQAKAEEAFRRGDLEPLWLMPIEFGGADGPMNRLYVPIGIADIKAGIDQNVIGPMAAAGQIKHYEARPEYQGQSFIPIAITIVASNPGNFTTTIQIWGDALTRD
jgi:hypothetical protein